MKRLLGKVLIGLIAVVLLMPVVDTTFFSSMAVAESNKEKADKVVKQAMENWGPDESKGDW